jgi:hypothetical protein
MSDRGRRIHLRKFDWKSLAIVMQHENRARWLIVLLAACLAFSLNFLLTDAPNSSDARQNLTAAHNLAYRGMISLSESANKSKPTNYREPLPIVFLAAHIALHPQLASGLTAKSINDGRVVVRVKQHNLIWAFLCLLGVAFATAAAVRPHAAAQIAAPIAVLLTFFFFLRRGSIIDRMMTELQAATLLAWSSFTLIRALKTGKPAWYAATGALMGALALTKAYFFYPALGLILTLALFYVWQPQSLSRLRVLGLMAVMAIAMAAVVAPWSIRNWVYFDTFEISQRGGAVMLIRAYKNRMTNVEYAGAYYVYAPESLKSTIGRLLGFSKRDLEGGGRLQRLNRNKSSYSASDREAEGAGRPEDAVTYYRKARAERKRLRMQYENADVENASQLAENALLDQAFGIIKADPWQHAKTTLLFLWRGTHLLGLPILIMAMIGVFTVNGTLIGLSLLPASAILFLALSSHFIPRYADPMIPSLVVAYVALISWVVIKQARRLNQRLQLARRKTAS